MSATTEMMKAELTALAIYTAGTVEREGEEPDYPSGADMVDYVNEMLTRLGMAREEPLVLDDDECSECGGTGLFGWDGRGIGQHGVISGERCDECAIFDGDLDAARFVAWAHPIYRWIVYVGVDNYERERVCVVDPRKPIPDNALSIGHGETVHLASGAMVQALGDEMADDIRNR